MWMFNDILLQQGSSHFGFSLSLSPSILVRSLSCSCLSLNVSGIENSSFWTVSQHRVLHDPWNEELFGSYCAPDGLLFFVSCRYGDSCSLHSYYFLLFFTYRILTIFYHFELCNRYQLFVSFFYFYSCLHALSYFVDTRKRILVSVDTFWNDVLVGIPKLVFHCLHRKKALLQMTHIATALLCIQDLVIFELRILKAFP